MSWQQCLSVLLRPAQPVRFACARDLRAVTRHLIMCWRLAVTPAAQRDNWSCKYPSKNTPPADTWCNLPPLLAEWAPARCCVSSCRSGCVTTWGPGDTAWCMGYTPCPVSVCRCVLLLTGGGVLVKVPRRCTLDQLDTCPSLSTAAAVGPCEVAPGVAG